MRNWIIDNFWALLRVWRVRPQDGFYLVIDSASSLMSDTLFSTYSVFLKTLARKLNIPLEVIYVDHEFQGKECFEPAGDFALRPRGVGGRDFRHAFRYIKDRNLHPIAVVYLTDGRSELFPPAPKFSVIWALIGDINDFDPPFGVKIQIINL